MKMKKLLAVLLCLSMVVSLCVFSASAAEDDGYYMFLAYGGDKDASGDWGWGYTGTDVDGITATTAYASAGDTVTIGLTFDTPVVYTWYMAPVIVAEGVTALEYTIDSITLDGAEVTPDLTLGDSEWWYEGTGDYTSTQSIRLKGGYNEWADAYIASPEGVSEIVYTITITSITVSASASSEPTLSTEVYQGFIAYGGDLAEENDWGVQYYGEDSDAVTGEWVDFQSGETTTVSLTFTTPIVNAWFFAPFIVTDDASSFDSSTSFEVKCYVDGVEVEIDFSAGDNWWEEATGDYNGIRIAGGYNEWGTQYISDEAVIGATTITYEITPTIYIAGAAEAQESTDEYYAYIVYGGDKDASGDWAASFDGGTASDGITATTATIKSGESFEIALTFDTAPVYVWYVSPVIAVDDPSVIDASTYFEVEVYIDGELVEYDAAAGDNWWAESSGAYSNAIRIAGGYNEWGTQYISQDDMAEMTELKYIITPHIYVGATEETVDVPFDTTQTYHAYLGVQTPTWIFRNAWYDSYGLDDEAVDFSQLGYVDGSTWVAQGGTFTDTEIYGDGTYSVTLEGFDFSGTFDGEAILGSDVAFNLLFVSTDLPKSDSVTISDVVLIMDGKTITTIATPTIDPDQTEYQTVQLINIWSSALDEMPYYAAPTTSIEIQFTVSGFGFDKEGDSTTDETEATDAATDATDAADDTDSSSGGLSTGAIVAIVIVAVVAVVVIAVVCGKMASKKKEN
ncbi:MAG: hypothetical protein LUH51_06165 [Firmicutes bacterium]|nr:hypothetical protein [Bacillota bacterium]